MIRNTLFRKRGRASCKKGFTLVEVIVAVVILLILATGFIPLINQGFGAIFRAGRLAQALQEAETRLVEARNGVDPNGAEPVSITFSGVADPVEANGHELVVGLDFEGESSSITFFSP